MVFFSGHEKYKLRYQIFRNIAHFTCRLTYFHGSREKFSLWQKKKKKKKKLAQ